MTSTDRVYLNGIIKYTNSVYLHNNNYNHRAIRAVAAAACVRSSVHSARPREYKWLNPHKGRGERALGTVESQRFRVMDDELTDEPYINEEKLPTG